MNNRNTADIFRDATGAPRVLAGLGICSGSTRLAEMAGRLGFDVVWIDMEHASHGLRDAESMCVAAEAGGALPLVRTMGSERDHILRALEMGGRIIVVPMVNDADTARRIVEYGKYPPLGRRGFYRYSRGLRFGEDPEWLATANATTILMPQIETLEAVDNLDAILATDGIGGILVGPGDLSADLGVPGVFDSPKFIQIVTDCLRRARAVGKHAAVLTPIETMNPTVLAAGAELVIIGADMPVLREAWTAKLAAFRDIPG